VITDSQLRAPIICSILAALITLLLKVAAYWFTGSVGLLSDAAESGVNLVAAITAYLSLWDSAQPVDASHTYGHEKIEYFSSGLEGILIIVAAAGILWYAVHRLIVPQKLSDLGIGAMVALLASAINLIVAIWLLRVGRRRQSIVLEANGHHLMTDVWTSVALIAGLGLVWLTGYEILDPLFALAIALNIVRTGFRLIRRSFDGLMDHALPAAEQQQVRVAIESALRPGTTFHALRTRQAGAHRFVDFHLLVPGRMNVRDAHRQAETIERAIEQVFDRAEVVIHIEPIEEPESYRDSDVLAVEEDTGLASGERP
jgi:cation diffusion facilitator family transporter